MLTTHEVFIPILIPLIQLKLAPPARKENNKLIQKLLTWKVEQKLVGLVRFQIIPPSWNLPNISTLTDEQMNEKFINLIIDFKLKGCIQMSLLILTSVTKIEKEKPTTH